MVTKERCHRLICRQDMKSIFIVYSWKIVMNRSHPVFMVRNVRGCCWGLPCEFFPLVLECPWKFCGCTFVVLGEALESSRVSPMLPLHLILSRGRHWARAGLRGLCACQVQVEISESKELWYFFSSSFGWETGLGSAQYLLQYHWVLLEADPETFELWFVAAETHGWLLSFKTSSPKVTSCWKVTHVTVAGYARSLTTFWWLLLLL